MHPALSEERLVRNLRAIGSRDPSLVKRLTDAVGSDHVAILDDPQGPPLLRITAPGHPVTTDRRTEGVPGSAGENAETAQGGRVLVLGVGFGYHLETLLRTNPTGLSVVAYERDPWLLRLALLRADFSREVLSGRLRFALGTDLASVVKDIRASVRLLIHPLLSELYATERTFVEDTTGHRRPETRRALVAAGGLFIEDVLETLRSRGVQTLVWDPSRLSLDESRHQIARFAPHFVFSINFVSGLPEVCEGLGIPYVVWEIDPGIERPRASVRDLCRTFVFTYRRANIPKYRRAGFRNVEHLPLAANPGRRFPVAESDPVLERYRCDVSFVGASMREQALKLRSIYLHLTKMSASGGRDARIDAWTSPDWWAREKYHPWQGLGDDAGELPRLATDERGRTVDLLYCLAETAASERRRRMVQSLLSFGCQIWGDTAWRDAFPSHPGYRGEAGHYRELTLIYNASRVNLDINRIYQRDIVAMRVFDVLACGAFVLADGSEELGELFNVGGEVAAYRDDAEVPALVEHFLKSPSERLAIAKAGRERVLRDHTMGNRMDAVFSRVFP